MLKVLTVFGTRPEAIKMVPVIKALERQPEHFAPIVCVTGQHRGMLDQVLELFGVRPHYDLNIMTPGQSPAQVTREVLERLDPVLDREQPHVVLVQGDTTTTFAASLGAFYHRIRVGHIEAGLRTLDKYQPFPEELNRRLTTVLADDHFAPTAKAKDNLLHEGVDESRVVVTGNTGIDALSLAIDLLRNRGSDATAEVGTLCARLDGKRMILVTTHRRENFGESMVEICRALMEIVERNPDVTVVFPVHPNPDARSTAARLLSGRDRIELVEPLTYAPFVALMDRAFLILTDSGGIQEEAPSLGKPVLVMRNVTERAEAVEAGLARLVGTKASAIVDEVQRALSVRGEYGRAAHVSNPFGDGKASERIAQYLLDRLSTQ